MVYHAPTRFVFHFYTKVIFLTSPSENNPLIKSKIDRVRRKELVEVWDKPMTIMYNSKAMDKSHNLDKWKSVLMDLADEQVLNILKLIEK